MSSIPPILNRSGLSTTVSRRFQKVPRSRGEATWGLSIWVKGRMVPVRVGTMGRRWGQHFLRYPTTARRMVEVADFSPYQPVLEIGPGSGVLTQALLERGLTVLAVEIDRRWVEFLQAHWPHHPGLIVVHGDVLQLDWRALAKAKGLTLPFHIIGSIPYEISSPLLYRLLEDEGVWDRVVLMVQQEFGERLVASPGTKAYGALSVLVQLRWTVSLSFRVPPSAFRPPPRVWSVVVRIDPRVDRPPEVLDPNFSAFVRAAFHHRRKMLVNSLARDVRWRPWVPRVTDCLKQMGYDPRVRAEVIAPARWVDIWRCLGASAGSMS